MNNLYIPKLFAIDVLWRDKAFVMRHGGYGLLQLDEVCR